MATVAVPLNMTLPATVARDLTKFRLKQFLSTCALSAGIDNQTTSITVNTLQNITVGCQLYTADGELMTVTAVPTDVTQPLTVVRGDTSILPTAGPAAHSAGTSISVLKFRDLVELGLDLARGDVQRILMSMGTTSETLTGVIA